MKSITSYPKQQQEIICKNLYNSGDLDNCKYSNVYNNCINDLNKTIKAYSKYGSISPKNINVVNDGVVYASEIESSLYVSYVDKKDDETVSLVLNISSMSTKVKYNGKWYSVSTGISDEPVQYFKFLPKWVNNLIGELTYTLGWFEVNVEDGVYDSPYNFKNFLEFLELYEQTYDTSDLDYSKYLTATLKTIKAHSYRAPAKKITRKPVRKNKVNKIVGNIKKYENSVRSMF